jgi:hypothetical protein
MLTSTTRIYLHCQFSASPIRHCQEILEKVVLLTRSQSEVVIELTFWM